jgi:hypothetical protein
MQVSIFVAVNSDHRNPATQAWGKERHANKVYQPISSLPQAFLR